MIGKFFISTPTLVQNQNLPLTTTMSVYGLPPAIIFIQNER